MRKFFFIFFILFVFLFLKTGVFAQSESNFSFNLHAPYNSLGRMQFPVKKDFYFFMDRQISKLGGIEIIRDSGMTGVVPKLTEPNGVTEDPGCGDREFLCRHAQFVAEPYVGWERLDTVVNHAHDNNWETMMEINLFEKVPDPDNPNIRRPYLRTKENVDTMLLLLSLALDRFSGKIKYWQVANTPGTEMWGFDEKTPDGQLLLSYAIIESAKLIREKCPECKIILPGIEGDNRFDRWKPWLERYYGTLLDNLKDKNAFDIVDFHHHHLSLIENTAYQKIKEKYEEINNLLLSKGYNNVPIWITEISSWTGSPVPDPWNPTLPYPFHSEMNQASELVKRFLYPFSLGVKKVFWSPGMIDFGNYGGVENSYFSNVGLIYKGGEKKISFEALRGMIIKLNGFISVERIRKDDPGLYLLKFNFPAQRGHVYVAWKEVGEREFVAFEEGKFKVTSLDGKVDDALGLVYVDEYPKLIEPESGYRPIECPAGVLGNLNCDSGIKVDEDDLAILLRSWMPRGPALGVPEGNSSADLDDNGKVDETDLNILLKRWKPF